MQRITGKRPKMHPMILGVDKEYEVKVGPLNRIKAKFKRTTKKGYNFVMSDGTKVLKQHIYPDKHCMVKGVNMIFWLPAMYEIKDETAITVSNFSFKNYERNWKMDEN
jgi:hypothetical protein